MRRITARLARQSRLALLNGKTIMNLHLAIAPIVALIAGILILVMPQLLNLIVAVYLIVVGVTGLLNRGIFSSKIS
jgi:hypothetical protein